METEPLAESVEVGKIGARTFATGALVQMLIMFLFWICLALLVGSGNGFKHLWVNHDTYLIIYPPGIWEVLPAFFLSCIIYTVMHFVVGMSIGKVIWRNEGRFLLPSLLAGFGIAVCLAGLTYMILQVAIPIHKLYHVAIPIVAFIFPSLLTALLSGWVCKKRLEDFAQKRGLSWPQDSI